MQAFNDDLWAIARQSRLARVFLAALCLTVSLFSSAMAQEIERFLSMGQAADWVIPVDRPTDDFPLGRDRGISYLLFDNQVRYSPTNTERFFHYVDHLQTPSGVEGNSAISLSFDPTYQTVSFHHLRRIRDGKETDILDLARFDLYRVETDREKLIYNGTLQLTYIIPDVRVGDILDYSYTITGKNPAFGSNFVGGYQHQFSVPIQRRVQRALFPANFTINVKTFGNPDPPEISTIGDFTEYVWAATDVPGAIVDLDIPPSYVAYPSTIFSTYDNWEAVGAHFAPFYDVTTTRSEQVRELASDIRLEHQTAQTRLRAALDFVQREIRYLGIEFGEGGFIPRQPDEVLANRFGDCKDMALLLIAILAELEIEAVPLLVNSETTDAVDAVIPSFGAFDHVIVQAVVDEKAYFLDPTRGVQLGDLEHLQQGDFGKGVLVAKDSLGVISAPVPSPAYWKDINDTYDVVSEPGAMLLTSVSTYYMGQADGMLAWYTREGAAAANKMFLEYFQNSYPQIEQMAPLYLDVDKVGGKVSITGRYRIPDAWDPGENSNTKDFYIQTDDVLQDMPAFIGTTRTQPYKLPHPQRTRQTLRFLLDDTWEIENTHVLIDQPAFRFAKTERFSNNIYSLAVTYETKSNEITVKDFRETMAAIREARDLVGVTLTITDAPQPGRFDTWISGFDNFERMITIWQAGAVLISLLVALALRNRDAARLSKQVFYPVSVMKFAILSTVSLGIYPIFWSYKNWNWARQVDSENISPGWRAFFMVLTNFALFDRIASRSGGYPWFRFAWVPLAMIILIGAVMGRIYGKEPDAPQWLFLTGMACMLAWIPVVLQVNKLNSECPECRRENSKFGWPTFGMLLLFSPVFSLIVYGFF